MQSYGLLSKVWCYYTWCIFYLVSDRYFAVLQATKHMSLLSVLTAELNHNLPEARFASGVMLI